MQYRRRRLLFSDSLNLYDFFGYDHELLPRPLISVGSEFISYLFAHPMSENVAPLYSSFDVIASPSYVFMEIMGISRMS